MEQHSKNLSDASEHKMVGFNEKEPDFSEARRLLVQRSKQNGHMVDVLNKVALKKAKFEQIEKNNKVSPQCFLKAHWEEGSSSYVKSFVCNPSQRKSFEELP